MKNFLVILLFLSFAARPVYYTGYLAYFQLNIEYIIDTYCVNKEKPQLSCNGKCHLSQKLNSQSANEDNSKTVSLNNLETFFPVYFTNTDYHLAELYNFIAIEKNYKNISTGYFYYFENDHFRPPVV